MSDLAGIMYKILHWTVKLTFWSAVVFGFVTILNLSISAINIGFNVGVLRDIFAMIQLWLPFNLSALLAWFTSATVAYFVYRLSTIAHSLIDDWFRGGYNG